VFCCTIAASAKAIANAAWGLPLSAGYVMQLRRFDDYQRVLIFASEWHIPTHNYAAIATHVKPARAVCEAWLLLQDALEAEVVK